MRIHCAIPSFATLIFACVIVSPVLADTFGNGSNTFEIDFASIGNAGNAPDTTGYGSIPYNYRIGLYEISQDVISKATSSGMSNVASGPWSGKQPAANISWYEAAAFVNWLNTSTGNQAAYDLVWSGSSWNMSLWSSATAWTLGGTNLYRHKDAFYFLPSESEWYKAAYYNPSGSNYFLYPTASNIAPTPVASGTNLNTAVYNLATNAPASVDVAGALSSYGTMGQGGNVWEWNESAADGVNDSTSEIRTIRGGDWVGNDNLLASSLRGDGEPQNEYTIAGFRVASIPEPSTYALLLMAGVCALWWAMRANKKSV